MDGDVRAILRNALERIADLEAQVRSLQPPAASRGRPGRKTVNGDIAELANERRPGMTWKATYYEWKREHPDDPRNEKLTPEKVRDAWQRHFRGKGKRQFS